MIYGLAHELGHNYYRIFNNEIDEILNYLPSGNPIFTSEIEACKWENLIRKENYQPKRVLYFYCNGFKVGKIID